MPDLVVNSLGRSLSKVSFRVSPLSRFFEKTKEMFGSEVTKAPLFGNPINGEAPPATGAIQARKSIILNMRFDRTLIPIATVLTEIAAFAASLTVIVVMMLLSSQLCEPGNPELFFSSLGVKKSGAPEHCIATSRTGQS